MRRAWNRRSQPLEPERADEFARSPGPWQGEFERARPPSMIAISGTLSMLGWLAMAAAIPPFQDGRPLDAGFGPSFDLETEDVAVGEAPSAGPLVIDRGPGALPIRLPDREVLEFDVVVDLGVLGKARAGTVTLRSGSERARSGLPLAGVAPAGGVVGYIESHARGKHMGYEIDHVLQTRIFPRDWPRFLYRDTQQGTENRRRELKIGRIAESSSLRSVVEAGADRDPRELDAWYRSNGHCKGCERREHFVESRLPWGSDHHCKKCKRGEHRIWKDAVVRSAPPGTVDMLSAIFLARTLVAEGLDGVTFPMLDKLELWDVTLTRGAESAVKVPAGTYQCIEVLLETHVPADEDREEEEFEGMFGIHGTIRIFVERASGVPVLITGDVPIGPIDLDAHVRLKAAQGAPASFRAIGEGADEELPEAPPGEVPPNDE